jgi:hypothetical protein
MTPRRGGAGEESEEEEIEESDGELTEEIRSKTVAAAAAAAAGGLVCEGEDDEVPAPSVSALQVLVQPLSLRVCGLTQQEEEEENEEEESTHDAKSHSVADEGIGAGSETQVLDRNEQRRESDASGGVDAANASTSVLLRLPLSLLRACTQRPSLRSAPSTGRDQNGRRAVHLVGCIQRCHRAAAQDNAQEGDYTGAEVSDLVASSFL